MRIRDQKNSDQKDLQREGLKEKFAVRVCALLLGGAVLCMENPYTAYAAQNTDAAENASSDGSAENAEEMDAGADTAESAAEERTEPAETEEHTQVLLPGAGFSYAFAARKVSLRDVEDNLYDSGLISAIRTEEKKGLSLNASAAENAAAGENSAEESDEASSDGSEEDNRAIAGTQLTPVQAREQSVVNAVSETQGIRIDNATATILSATAVTVVSDANIAVQLAQMVDRKKAQMQLDQGVISASEAEALLASAQGDQAEEGTDATISITEGGDGSDAGQTAENAEDGDGAAATDSDGNELVVAQVNDFINVRADADTESEIVGKLYNGSVAKVLGRTGNGWARIQSGDVTGYIREEYVATGETAQQLVDSVSTKQAVVTTQTLRVRAAAQADSDVITLIGQGETLDILEEKDGWYKVDTPDGEGYISSDFADVEEIYPEAISKEQEEAEEAAAEASRKAEEEAAKEASDAAASKKKKSGSKKSSGSGALNTYTGSSSSGSSTGQAVANYALQFVGNPYVWGGTSLTNGADCSGFTMAVYANFGVSLPHYTGSQQQCGTAVSSLAEAQPGDLILYSGHVAIYLGNNQIVHASNPRYGITTGTATYRNIVAIRRIFN